MTEFLEQPRQLLNRHADAGIRYRELDPLASVNHSSHPQRDLPLLGELARIAQQIEQDLPQPHRIDGQRSEMFLALRDQAILVLLGKLAAQYR